MSHAEQAFAVAFDSRSVTGWVLEANWLSEVRGMSPVWSGISTMLRVPPRIRGEEMLDNLDLEQKKVFPALRALGRMNQIGMNARSIALKIHTMAKGSGSRLRILDLGAGGGDELCRIAHLLNRLGYQVEAIGGDRNTHSVQYANRQARMSGAHARFVVQEALDAVEERGFDFAISSLFLHHLAETEIFALFNSIRKNAGIGMVMTDLERSWLTHAMVRVLPPLISRSRVVHHDGLVSAAGALSLKELQYLGDSAELAGLNIRRVFPARVMLSWECNRSAELAIRRNNDARTCEA